MMKSRYITQSCAAFLITFVACSASAQKTPSKTEIFALEHQCVSALAKKYEPSGESAAIIADTVANDDACDIPLTLMQGSFGENGVAILRSEAKRWVQREIVQTRAERHSGNGANH